VYVAVMAAIANLDRARAVRAKTPRSNSVPVLVDLRQPNQYSVFRRRAEAIGSGFPMEVMDEDNVQYDVDMIKIRNLRPQWLPFLAYGLVDLAGREPYVKKFQISQEDLGFCIVAGPIYVFIDRMKRVNFTEALVDSVGERFLHLSGERCKFLHSGPRKCHIEHVIEALSRTDIPFVNVYTYGNAIVMWTTSST